MKNFAYLLCLVMQLALADVALPASYAIPDEQERQEHMARQATDSIQTLESVDNNSGSAVSQTGGTLAAWQRLWQRSDTVTRFALAVLLIMAGSAAYISLTKLLAQIQLFRQIGKFNGQTSASEVWKKLTNHQRLHSVFAAGEQALLELSGNTNQQDIAHWLDKAFSQQIQLLSSQLQNRLGILASIAATAPLIGICASVWGICQALRSVDEISIEHLSGPTAGALIMTVIGLAVAIGAVFCYMFLRSRNQRIIALCQHQASQLQRELQLTRLSGY